jgi:hypothetical protein
MMNQVDQQELATSIADIFRVKMAHRNVNVSTDDIMQVRGAIKAITDQYVDNSMIQNTQYDPRVGQVVNVEDQVDE